MLLPRAPVKLDREKDERARWATATETDQILVVVHIRSMVRTHAHYTVSLSFKSVAIVLSRSQSLAACGICSWNPKAHYFAATFLVGYVCFVVFSQGLVAVPV